MCEEMADTIIQCATVFSVYTLCHSRVFLVLLVKNFSQIIYILQRIQDSILLMPCHVGFSMAVFLLQTQPFRFLK